MGFFIVHTNVVFHIAPNHGLPRRLDTHTFRCWRSLVASHFLAKSSSLRGVCHSCKKNTSRHRSSNCRKSTEPNLNICGRLVIRNHQRHLPSRYKVQCCKELGQDTSSNANAHGLFRRRSCASSHEVTLFKKSPSFL